ncbi:Uma2 family endonuclease [Pseudanabaena galeata UHCC 0370]|uniref:Uma2 family endonuclease n=1 Tax=Pseudanabaena galeata UHCC 0370 TaxID=3110310 RepID=A0ABU5THU8_9CYAN|nr:Uma2 family endonuclease [Pseudanabaena galeata]MEA5477651.1 Uma2 family endonuclease [Pseudanabaena galeata UHCC 0370]
MATLVKVAQIETLQGQTTVLHDIDWHQFEAILEDLGDNRSSRIAYFDGVLEIRMPLPEHERTKVIISNLLVILLEELDWEWESLGSSTFKTKSMKAGIEPDDCFYIKNYAAMIGKKRLDMSIDPPPDIVIEVDLTSNTQISAYEALAVAEIWRYANGRLSIRLLREGKYVESLVSLSFPDFPVIDGISQFLERGAELSISSLRREFRQWVRDRLH